MVDDNLREYAYFTFPISFLDSAFKNIKGVCRDAIRYALYNYARKQDGDNCAKMKSALEFHHIDNSGNLDAFYTQCSKLFSEVKVPTTFVSLKIELIFDFRDNPKTELQIVYFLAFAALKSIKGSSSYAKTNNRFMLARMSGTSDISQPLSETLAKYNKRYHLDNIKLELKTNWKVKLYGYHTQGFYFSFKLSLRELTKIVETKRKNYKQKMDSLQQKAARSSVLTELYGYPDTTSTTTP